MITDPNQRLLDKLQQDLTSAGAMPLYLRFNESVRQAIELGILSQGDFLQGRKPDTMWISREQIPADSALAEKLSLAEHTPVYKLKRIHFIDQRPMSVAVSYVVAEAIANVDDIGVSLYDYFRLNNVELGSLRSQVSAAMSDGETLQALQLKDPMPLLIIKQTLFDSRKKPIEYSESFCRSDMYEFISED